MKTFNVIIENHGKFEPYDIMGYLKNEYEWFTERCLEIIKDPEYTPDKYWKIPKTRDDFKEWIENSIKYRYWGRCEYEIILSEWPNPKNNPGKKIDIYEQCMMNLDVITDLFLENIKEN